MHASPSSGSGCRLKAPDAGHVVVDELRRAVAASIDERGVPFRPVRRNAAGCEQLPGRVDQEHVGAAAVGGAAADDLSTS